MKTLTRRWGHRLLAIAALAAGGAIGFFNALVVPVDLMVLSFESRLGVVLLGAFACGFFGGMIWGRFTAARRRRPAAVGGDAGQVGKLDHPPAKN